MPEVEDYEVLILGSGQGGKLLAWHLARAGHKVAVVERQWIGGSCPNVACLPSKNELWSARVAHLARHAGEYGTQTGDVAVDMARVWQRKQAMVDFEVGFHVQMYRDSGAELILGAGRFVAPRTVQVALNEGGARTIRAEKVFVNVGTRAAMPAIDGLDTVKAMTHVEALELDYVPSKVIVLGGGYIGIEMAQAFRRFGSAVTVIEPSPQIMSREDADVSEEMRGILTIEGIDIVTDAKVTKVFGRSGRAVTVCVRTPAGETFVEGSDLLVAAGRIPNTAGIGLDHAGVELDSRGYIRVNDRLETSAPGVWAIGECAGSPQFTHASVDDFRIVRDNLAGGDRSTADRLVPYCLFTDPPLAHVGLSERDAQQQGIAVRIARMPMARVLRTQATSEARGFLKVLVARDDDRIVGFTMIGAEAGEVMATMQTAMLAGLPYQKLRDAVIAHLTVAEALGPLLGSIAASSS
ncbi:mercuric reductase [Cupriavidus pampae]|uniref:Pyridine nucleotide-disulfide oxidoreductase RclA n=1 Tax=Cupriavidus pampae TaxID=659251 RepID=A0ABM8X218_9BURK|nr:mercuric reductase [Cupriavidus pampae]CAG9173929.1 putative pyridine nucleotide-disulfide oxidoreductase RclA [Cupriavidus pampae]